MTDVQDMIDTAVGGFLHEGGGRNLAATLAAIPGMFTAFSISLTALATWMEDKPCSQSAAVVAAMAQRAAIAAETAGQVSDQFRKDNAFWLDAEPDGQVSHGVTGLADLAAGGFIPQDPDHPDGQVLDITLEQLPELFDVISDHLGIMASWMRENHMSGAPELLLGELARYVSTLATAAETVSSTYRQGNAFWLAGRRLL